MGTETHFGELTFPDQVSQRRRAAILRALNWCNDMVQASQLWSKGRRDFGLGIELSRQVNGKVLKAYPLLAAKMDAGVKVSEFEKYHLPVMVDDRSICIVGARGRGRDLHTDLVATTIMLFSAVEPETSVMPRTLLRAIYPDLVRPLQTEAARIWQANQTRREEVFGEFQEHVAGGGNAVEYLDALPPGEWHIMRDFYPWHHDARTAIAYANVMSLDLNKPVNDHLWVMNIVRQFELPTYQEVLLPAYLRFHQTEVRAQALREYQQECPQLAMRHLGPCLWDEVESLAWEAHELLQTYPELHEALVIDSLAILEDAQTQTYARQLLGWLSQHRNMDEEIQQLLPTLEPHELSQFLRVVHTHGPWLETFGETCLEMPFEGVHHALIEATKRNTSFNPFKLWLPLMQNGPGTMKLAILRSLEAVTEEQAFELLELGWTSQWRFVITNTHHIVKKHFPQYPHRQAMEEHGYRSAFLWKDTTQQQTSPECSST